jgi:leucyl aminopeptidase
MKVSVVTAAQAKADAYIVGVASKDKKRTTAGLKAFGITSDQAKWLMDSEDTALGFKQVLSVPCDKGALVMVGLGDVDNLNQEKLGTAINNAIKHVLSLGITNAATTLLLDSKMAASEAAQALAQGAIIGELKFDQYKGKEDAPKSKNFSLQVVADSKGLAATRKVSKNAAILAEATNDARLLGNTPANICTPKWLAAEARKRGKKNGFKVSVKGRSALVKEGYGGLAGVGQGSDNEEQLIVMDYNPAGAKKTIVVVGKAVTFDSGGISIKPGNLMWEMKYDKCGGCNVVALMPTMEQLGIKHRVIGIVPAAENMPGGRAQRPGDIITTKKGTTVEVLNTDAEGRLILADAVFHGTSFKPDWMVDMATLTGACEFAVGTTYVAAMGKDQKLVQSFIDASHEAGDKAWQVPQGEEFDEANKGTYADMQNISLTTKAGASIGGSFVGHFAGDVPFVHLDIASKAWTKGVNYFGNGPTGAGLRIVAQRILNE